MARKSRYREYLNAVRNVKVLSKAPQRRTTHESILRSLTVRGQFWGVEAPLNERLCLLGTSRHCLLLYQEFLLSATFYFIIVQNYRYD